jgi:hypothetical protein
LTTIGVSLAQAERQGRSLVWLTVALTVVSAGVGIGVALAERHLTVPRVLRTAFTITVVAALLAVAGAVWARYGSPVHLAREAWSSFQLPPKDTGANQSARLLQLSNNGRIDLWKTSWRAFEQQPVIGNGAGTFWELLAENPAAIFSTRYGHSIYVETLGELGAIGLALLMVFFATPVASFLRRGRDPALAAAVGAYAAWLAHMAIEWDWQLAGVSSAGLLCGVALMSSTPRQLVPVGWSLTTRAALAVTLVAAAGLSLAPLISEEYINSGRQALSSHFDVAVRDGRNATRWAPWSSNAWMLRGDAAVGVGDFAAARHYYMRAISEDPQNWMTWRRLAGVVSGSEQTRVLAQVHRLHPGRG